MKWTGDLVGKVIKHEKFLDTAILVHSVGKLVHAPKEVHITGIWMNQGFTKSWIIREFASFTIKIEDLEKWFVCVDDGVDPCLRKCPWERLG